MSARCSTWKKADHHLHFARPKGEAGYVVKYDGHIVRHGSARTLAAAKRMARKQAGATGGVP